MMRHVQIAARVHVRATELLGTDASGVPRPKLTVELVNFPEARPPRARAPGANFDRPKIEELDVFVFSVSSTIMRLDG